MKSFLLLVATLVVHCYTQELAKDTCDAKRRFADVGLKDANVIIGGIFDLRSEGFAGYSCGDPTDDMQLYEAARFALKRINDNRYVPGVTFGMKTYDTCSSPDMATKAALDFFPQYSTTEQSCSVNAPLKLGLLGTLKSKTSISVAKMTKDFPVSMVSPKAAASELSFKRNYPYFLRTNNPFTRWSKVAVDVAKSLGWNRVIIVHTDNFYGKSGKDELIRLAHYTSGVCVSDTLAVKSSGTASDYAAALANLKQSNTVGAIFIGDATAAKVFLSGIQSAVQTNSNIGDMQWIFSDLNSNEDFAALPYTKGVIYIGPKQTDVSEFTDYWVSINERVADDANPWFQDWYAYKYKCFLPDQKFDLSPCSTVTAAQKRNRFKQDIFVPEVIKAVYAYAEALKTAHSSLCGSSSGICQQLRSMTTETFHNSYLKNVDFTFGNAQNIGSLNNQRVKFDNNGDPSLSEFVIYNYNDKQNTAFSFKQVGTETNGVLSFNSADVVGYNAVRSLALNTYPSSPCPGGECGSCLTPALVPSYSFYPGDIILGAFMDFHWPGSSPLTCGDIWGSGAQLGLSYRFAFDSLKKQFPDILNGVDLGALILDVCMDDNMAKLYLSHLYSGRISSSGQLSSEAVDTSRLPLYLETSPAAARSLADILSLAKTPVVDSTSTSSTLSSDKMYKYFTRTLPGDDKQARAISKLLLHMGWTYVQTVQDTSLYGRNGIKDFISAGIKDSICVAQINEIPESPTTNDFDMLVQKLLEKPEASVVVVFAWENYIRKLFEAVKRAGAKGKLMFVASESWGDSQVLQGIEDVNEGTMAVQLKKFDIDGMASYFSNLKPSTYKSVSDSMWFENYYESVGNCYLNPLHSSMYPTACTDQALGSLNNWSLSQYVPYAVFGVYAAANALDKTLKELCGPSYNGVCANYRSSAEVGDKILENLKDISFEYNEGATSQKKTFQLRDGEGIADYRIISFRSTGDSVEIANYNNYLGVLNTFLPGNIVYPNGVQSFKSSCSQKCRECSYLFSHKTAFHIPGDIQIGALLPVHKAGTRGPFSCGDIKTNNGFQYVTALAYAVSTINDGTGPFDLPGLDLGALVIDYCQNPTNAYGLTTALYSGVYNPLQKGMDKTPYPVSKIGAWLTDSSSSTAEVNEIIRKLNLPLISPSATKSDLNANSDYPTFFRTLQGDDVISLGISKICRALGFNYVQVVYSDTTYGRGALNTFTALARQDSICVTYSYKFGVDGTADEIITEALGRGTDVIVLFTSTSDTTTFMAAVNNRNVNERKLKFITPEPYTAVMAQYPVAAKDTISLKIRSPPLAGYRKYLESLSVDDLVKNPYYREFYQAYFKCDLTGESKYGACTDTHTFPDSSFEQENFVLTTINAVYAFAGAIDAVLKEKCGIAYTQMCDAAKKSTDFNEEILRKLDSTTFTDPTNREFQFVNREANVVYEVLRYDVNQYVLEGSFAGASLLWEDYSVLKQAYKTVESTCEAPCQMCLEKSLEFTYIPGDILLGGLFDVHVRGVNPFSCGVVKTLHGFQLLEAFQFALNKVNSKDGMFKDILPNVRLGGVGLDTCESAVRSGYIVSNIFSGRTVLNKDGTIIDPENIVSYIGGYESDRSMYVARILKTLGISQVSYKSSSIDLLDRQRFPYFLSTVPSDDKLATALVKILDKFDIRYVQVIHTDNQYGISGAKMFKEIADKNKICVAQTTFFPDNGTVTVESAKSAVTNILKKPNANVVVLFANTEHVEEFLKAVNKDGSARHKFIFVGTDTWANQMEVIEKVDNGNENIARGSITVNTEYEDLRSFDAYIGSKTTANYPENPWFADYYQELQNCYLTTVNTRYPRQCSTIPTSVIKSRRYRQDPGILNVINAVFASAFGIHNALKQICGPDYTTVCESFVNYEKKGELLKTQTQTAAFKDLSGKEFSFNDRGDGKKGFFYYQVEETIVKEHEYTKIGSITSDEEVTAVAKLPVSWDGSCTRPDTCTECPSIRNRDIRYMIGDSSHADPVTIVGVFNIHKTGTDDYLCGPLSLDGGFLQTMAFFYAIDRAKNLPFGLRGLVLDTCSKDLRVDQDIYGLVSGNGLCNSEFNVDGISSSNIGAFLTQFTTNTYAAGRVLPTLKISFLSSSATSDVFSNQRRYNYFARTVPPDAVQMKLIADILKDMGWDYISLVHDNSVYGISGAGNLKSYLKSRKLCFATTVQLPVDLSPGGAEAAVNQLDKIEESSVVVMIGYQNTISEMLQAVKRLGKQQRFLWIGTDTWGNSPLAVSDVQGEPIEAITLTLRSTLLNDFDTYLKETLRFSPVDLSRPKSIPQNWFEEFYQKTFKCSLPRAAQPLDFDDECTLSEDLQNAKDRTFLEDGYILQTIAATDAITGALTQFRTEYCKNAQSLQECFQEPVFKDKDPRAILFQFILNTQKDLTAFYNLQDNFFLNFTSGRYWDVGYDIYRYDGSKYDKVSRDDLKDLRGSMRNSTCYEKYQCLHCDEYPDETVAPVVAPQKSNIYGGPRNFFHYKSIWRENQNKYDYEQDLDWPVWAVVVAILTCIGLLVGIIVFLFLLISYPTFGGTSILGFMIMLGILGIYAINFAFFLPAAMATCTARRLVMGITYAIVFGALLVKAIDNWRFSDVEYTVRRYKGVTNPCALFFIALGIVLIEAIIPIEWLILVHPTASRLSKDATHDYMWCDPFTQYDEGLALSFIFIIFLVLITAVFAGLAWESENNYYESRWILVSAVSTAGCFLVWMVVTTNAGAVYRDPAVAIGNLVNATALLIFLPIRKMALLISVRMEQRKGKMNVEEIYQADSNELYSTAYTNSAYEGDVNVQKLSSSKESINGRL